MIDAFIIDKLKKEKRREQRREIQIPLYIEEPLSDEEISNQKKKNEQAEKENHKAKRMFKYALEAEKVHAELYKLALQAVEQGKDLDISEIYLCPVCGHIEFGKPKDKCPICGALPEKYIQV